MTRYEQGFINKCAEYGIDGRVVLQKLAQAPAAQPAAAQPNWVKRQWNAASSFAGQRKNAPATGAIGGAAAGALALALHEALRKQKGPNDRKDYLKKILLGLAAGGAAGAAGGYWGPGLYDKAKPGVDVASRYLKNLGGAIAGKGVRTPKPNAEPAKK